MLQVLQSHCGAPIVYCFIGCASLLGIFWVSSPFHLFKNLIRFGSYSKINGWECRNHISSHGTCKSVNTAYNKIENGCNTSVTIPCNHPDCPAQLHSSQSECSPRPAWSMFTLLSNKLYKSGTVTPEMEIL